MRSRPCCNSRENRFTASARTKTAHPGIPLAEHSTSSHGREEPLTAGPVPTTTTTACTQRVDATFQPVAGGRPVPYISREIGGAQPCADIER